MRKLKNEELKRIDVESYKSSKKFPLIILLDNIRSMHNVGATFRSADAFRVEKIYLTGITAQPPHRDINKAALGATESVEWSYFESPVAAINELKNKGYQIFAVEQADKSIALDNWSPDGAKGYALVFGNEVFGVSDDVMALVDGVIEIPQFGTKHSLNVSVSVGVLLWDFYQKIKPFSN